MATKKTKPKNRRRPVPERPKRPVRPGSSLIVTPPPRHVVPPSPVLPRPPRPGRRVVPPPVAPVAVVPVPVVPAPNVHGSAEQLVRDAKRLGAAAAGAFYLLGLVLRELAKPEKIDELGYKSFAELLDRRHITNAMTAYRVMSIVDAFEQRTAEKLGVEKAYAVIRYAVAARPGEKVIAVLHSDPMLRLRKGTTRLSEATTRQVFEAISVLRRTELPETHVKRVHRVTRGLSQVLERVAIRTAHVKSVRHGSEMLVRVEIDALGAEKLLAMLRR